MTEEKCEHIWIPNGMAVRKIYKEVLINGSRPIDGEVIISSCVCEKCGEIKTSRN